jgi:hypothetical protein
MELHKIYPEAMPEKDGTFTGRIYSLDGEELHIRRKLENKEAFAAWVQSVNSQYQRGK